MAVAWLTVDLRVWHSDGEQVPDRAFLGKLKPVARIAVKKHRSREAWESARVTLVSVQADKFDTKDEPSEAFAAAVRKKLLNAAKWLDGQPSALFAGLLDAGYEADVFIESWIDQDQFEVELPPKFIAACGRVGLGVSLLTND